MVSEITLNFTEIYANVNADAKVSTIALPVLCTGELKNCLTSSLYVHYANMAMHYTAIFHSCKNVNFQMKNIILFFFCSKH